MTTSVLNVAKQAITGRRNGGQDAGSQLNVSETERWLCLLGGSALALSGLSSRGGFNRLMLPLAGGALIYRGLTGHCPLYQSLGIDTREQTAPATAVKVGSGVKVEESITVNWLAADLYRFWRQFDQLPRFMHHVQEVKVLGDKRSHWVARAPLGMKVEWDAEIINERENELIAWRSLEGSDVDTAGSVHFKPAPGGRGTEVHLTLKYDPPGGQLGATVAWLLGESPEVQIREDLRRFKQLLEAGELAQTTGLPIGSRRSGL